MLHEKILKSSIAAVFEGRIDDLVIKCSKKQRSILESAIIATKRLEYVLESKDPKIDDVMTALEGYALAKKRFAIMFNVSWPL